MTLDKVGERFVLGFTGDKVPTWLFEFASRYSLGGVILFDYDFRAKRYENNIRSRDQVRELNAALAALPSHPLIFVDQEGGKVRRLKESLGFAPLPSQKALAKMGNDEAARLLENAMKEMRDLGFGYDLAPVIDLDTNPNNPDIGAVERSYSVEPAEVLRCLRLIDKAARKAGLGLCLKHYPGLGGAKVNSHLELTDLTGSFSDEQLALFFEQGGKITGEAVLISHGIVRGWDPRLPTSMSPVALDKLRERLPSALFVSDDLQMQGLQKILPSREACVQGARAGIDLLLLGNNLLDEHARCDEYARALAHAIDTDAELADEHRSSINRIADRKMRFATQL